MFNNQDRVSKIPKMLESLYEPAVVSLMKADGRLIQNIQNAFQTTSDLACQTNSLSLATGKRRRRSIQGQIVEAYIEQEVQSGVNFFDDGLSNDAISIA